MRDVFESFESDLSRAHPHFWICGHPDGSNFENDVFSPPPRCHVLVDRAALPPHHHLKMRPFDASAPGDSADFFLARNSTEAPPYVPDKCTHSTLKNVQKHGFSLVFRSFLNPILDPFQKSDIPALQFPEKLLLLTLSRHRTG